MLKKFRMKFHEKYRKSALTGDTSGFTLMEMLIVIALIGLMATVVGVNVIRRFFFPRCSLVTAGHTSPPGQAPHRIRHS